MNLLRTLRNCVVLVLAFLYAVSCSAFTAPKDPVTGIRQDAPDHWDPRFDPAVTPAGDPPLTPLAEGRFGHSNKGVTW